MVNITVTHWQREKTCGSSACKYYHDITSIFKKIYSFMNPSLWEVLSPAPHNHTMDNALHVCVFTKLRQYCLIQQRSLILWSILFHAHNIHSHRLCP